jgi:hypothetical protein
LQGGAGGTKAEERRFVRGLEIEPRFGRWR